MALPTPQKVWEFDTNRPMIGATNSGTSHGQLAVLMKNMLMQVVNRSHLYAEGSIATVSGSTRRIDPTGTSDTTRYNPSQVGNLVGKTVRIKGSTTSGNNGDFVITAQSVVSGSVYAIEYVNASGAAESVAGSVQVIDYSKISEPWILSHSGKSSGGGTIESGVLDDGVDKIRSVADYTMNSSAWSYFVLRNEATGTELMMSGRSTGSVDDGEMMEIAVAMSPNRFLARSGAGTSPAGASITQPDGTTTNAHVMIRSNSVRWFNAVDEAAAAWSAVAHLAMSDDGKHTRLVLCYNGFVTAAFFDEEVQDPVTGWDDAQVASFITAAASAANGITIANTNDSAHWVGGNIARDSIGTLYNMRLFSTGEGSTTSLNGEQVAAANDIAGEVSLGRIGLLCTTPSFRGRHGLLKDLYWGHTALAQGNYFPADNTKQLLCIGAWVMPWDGSIAELS